MCTHLSPCAHAHSSVHPRLYVHTLACTPTSVHAHTYLHACTHPHVHTRIHPHMHTPACVHTLERAHTAARACTLAHIHMCIYQHVYIHPHVHTHLRMHTHLPVHPHLHTHLQCTRTCTHPHVHTHPLVYLHTHCTCIQLYTCTGVSRSQAGGIGCSLQLSPWEAGSLWIGDTLADGCNLVSGLRHRQLMRAYGKRDYGRCQTDMWQIVSPPPMVSCRASGPSTVRATCSLSLLMVFCYKHTQSCQYLDTHTPS